MRLVPAWAWLAGACPLLALLQLPLPNDSQEVHAQYEDTVQAGLGHHLDNHAKGCALSSTPWRLLAVLPGCTSRP